MATFRDFISLAAPASTAAGAAWTLDDRFSLPAAGLSLFVMVIAFTYWRLDQRARDLLEISKKALKRLERLERKTTPAFPDLFHRELRRSQAQRRMLVWHDCRTHRLTYLQCFGIIYAFFGISGYVGLLASLVKLVWTS